MNAGSQFCGQQYQVFEFGLGGVPMAYPVSDKYTDLDEALERLADIRESLPNRTFKLLHRGISPWREIK